MKLKKSTREEIAKSAPIVIGPASKKQEQFLNSDSTITLAGGAAGLTWPLSTGMYFE